MSEMPLPPAVRLLGSSGIAISSLMWVMRGLTAAGLDAAGAARLVKGVRDAGITLLDTADIYGFDGAARCWAMRWQRARPCGHAWRWRPRGGLCAAAL